MQSVNSIYKKIPLFLKKKKCVQLKLIFSNYINRNIFSKNTAEKNYVCIKNCEIFIHTDIHILYIQ